MGMAVPRAGKEEWGRRAKYKYLPSPLRKASSGTTDELQLRPFLGPPFLQLEVGAKPDVEYHEKPVCSSEESGKIDSHAHNPKTYG